MGGAGITRLSLCMVVRDCARTLRPLLRSVRPHVDQIVIVLGGPSRDRTEQVAREFADVVVPFEWRDDFAAARNEALRHVTGKFWMWLDGDDALEHPERLPEVLDYMERQDLGRCDLLYLYDFDEHGNPTLVHTRERIMRTDLNFYWRDPVHETCHSDTPHLIGFSDRVVVRHRRARAGSSERNLPILLRMLEEDPSCQRARLHVAHAYFSLGRYDLAQQWYERYLEAPEDEPNQWNACMMAARCSFLRQDWAGVASWSLAALAVTPLYSDPYLFLAHAAWWGDGDADRALSWLAQADRAEMAPLAVFRNPLDYTVNRWDVEHRAWAAKGDFKRALELVRKAYQVQPDRRWGELVQYYEEAVRAERSVAAALQLADHLVRRSDLLRAEALLSGPLPATVREDPRIGKALARIQGWLRGPREEPGKWYEEHDDLGPTRDVSGLPRVQWYIERLRARRVRTVLEVGCHVGDVTRALAQAGFEVLGLDINPKAVARAYELTDAGRYPNVAYRTGELKDVRDTFDAVLLAEVLEHLPPGQQMKMLAQAEELAPVVLGSVPAEFLPYSPGLFEESGPRTHVWEFDQRDLEELILTAPGRRIVNCFKIEDPAVGPGFGNRVFEFDHEDPQGLACAFYLGEGPGYWSPHDIETRGLGGSETSAARLAEALARAGHRVVVYAMEQGVHQGVVYRRHELFDPKAERDVVVCSRRPWELKERPNAKVSVLWAHDVDYGPHVGPWALGVYDYVVVLSEWHREHWLRTYPFWPAERVRVIGHGLRRYNTRGVRRVRHRLAYTSSPDRGLHVVLAAWPEVHRVWPDAELHVFYGFEYFPYAERSRPYLRSYRQQVLSMARQEGVHLRGRVGQRELARELAASQFWLHPAVQPDGSDWHETFCIAAVEARAYGAVPLVRPVGALAERVPEEFWLPDASPETLVRALLHWDELWPRVPEPVSAPSWDEVAAQWLRVWAEVAEAKGAHRS